jgi:hypothetical protein
MNAIWPGDDRYEGAMEAAKEEYEIWLNRNKADFVIAKKAEKVKNVDDFDLDEFDPYNAELDGWSEKEWADEMNYN